MAQESNAELSRPFPAGTKDPKASQPGRPRRWLIRGTNWIGDSVMSVAALKELRRLYPEDHLTLMAKPWVAGLFEGQGLIDEIIPAGTGTRAIQQVLQLRRRPQRFDAALLFPNAFAAALTVFAARIPERLGYRRDARRLLLTRSAQPRIRSLGRHQVYYYLDLLYQTGLSCVDYLNEGDFQPDIGLHATPEGLHKCRLLLQQRQVDPGSSLVTINPGAYFGPAKRWFVERYAAVADRLIEEANVKIVLIGSAGELAIARQISGLMKHIPHILTGDTDLSTLMALLSISDLFITNDSGPMHLAAALNVPQIALFGSTDEVATGPFSHRAQVIHKHVQCSPCLLRSCPIDLRCFDKIGVQEVLAAARRMLDSNASRRTSD